MFDRGRFALLGLVVVACGPSGSGTPPGSGGAGGAGNDASASGGSGGTLDAPATIDNAPPADAPGDPGSAVDQGGSGGAGAGADTAAQPETGDAAGSCPPGALLCDDFEKYTAGGSLAPTWTTDLVGGMVRVDTTRPFAGKQSVHITASTNVTNMLQIVTQNASVFPAPGNMFYGRMMYWLSEMPPDHTNIIQASGTLPGSTQVAKYAYGIKYKRLMAGYTVRVRETDSPFVDCGNKPAAAGYPEKQWMCLEWQFDGSKDEMHHWVNGKPQPEVDVVKTGGCPEGGAAPAGGTWRAPTFNKLMLGFYAHPYATPIDVWIDDVVVSSKPIGCPPMP